MISNTEIAYNKGYYVVEGKVFNKNGKELKLKTCTNGYLCFSIHYQSKNKINIFVHQLVAYQKFGERYLEKDIVARHLDGNKLNNSRNNIEIGTLSQNQLDRPAKERRKYSIEAATQNRRFTDSELLAIRDLHKETKSYSTVMKKFNISSKGTLAYILKTQYVTTK